MPEGLKLVIGADVNEANKALAQVSKGLTGLEKQVAAFGGGVKKFASQFNTSFNALPPVIKKTEAALTKLPRASNAASQSLINLGRIAQDAPFGIIGIANNINPLLEGFQRLRAESGSTSVALKSLAAGLIGGGGLGLAVSVVTGLMSAFALSNRGAKEEVAEQKKEVTEAAEKQKAFAAAIDNAAKSVVSQADKLKDLRAILLSTDAATKQVTESTIKQGLARFIFDEKNVELQKIIAAQIERQIILRKRLVGVAGLEEFTNDKTTIALEKQQKAMQAFGQGGNFSGLAADTKRLKELNATIGASGGEINFLNALGPDLEGFFKSFLDKPEDAAKETDKFIDAAKQLNSELEKIGFVAPVEFSFFDNPAETLAKAKKVFADFQSRNLKIQASVFTVPLDISEPPPEKVVETLTETEKLLRRGVLQLPPVEIPVEFSATEEQNAAIISDFRKKFETLGVGLNLAEGDLADPALFNKLDNQFKQTAAAIQVADLAAQTLSNTFQSLFSRIIEGENPIKAFFQSIGQAILQLITQLIAAAIKAAIFKAILSGATGGGSGFLSFLAGGITGFAQGGIVSGPTLALVGEGVGTSRSNPEVIAPLDQLKSMLSGLGGSGTQVVVVNGRTRGNQFELLANRTNRQNRRLGAG